MALIDNKLMGETGFISDIRLSNDSWNGFIFVSVKFSYNINGFGIISKIFDIALSLFGFTYLSRVKSNLFEKSSTKNDMEVLVGETLENKG